ncbi:MAG: glycoside hydrolase/phage tail family protein, partial [Rhodobacteraceae bacterium]|nr:glycoside hydrolase/phage tail family protein [Paracoccaceae bacterium]
VISYGGPAEWSFRRFVLHQAHLCAAAGGVDAFCIGSETRGLTQIRGASGFPAVAHLQTLAADVRSVLGAGCKLGYAADWSEYHGYQPSGTGDKYFHLDPLWADSEIDFIGIDNYMPLSDWRDGEDHADVSWGSIYNLDYLTGNVAGGEGYDWYYHSDEARDAQIRTPITDLAEAEPWIWRYKDIQGWWSHLHHDRIGGIRQVAPSAWVPGMKPIWFTEMGCAAINKGTNQPNKFLDPKSSESSLPHYSNGLRDEFMQLQYIRAMTGYYAELDNNPVSLLYGQPMVDMQRAHVWAWDARPFPAFPAREDLWSDGENYARGHWLNGRSTSRPLSAVVTEICAKAGVTDVETDRLWGLVRGYRLDDSQTARAALQVLMLAYSFDVVERDGKLVFISRTGQPTATMSYDELAFDPEENATVETMRSSAAERAGRVRLGFIEGEGNYDAGAAEAVFADDPSQLVSSSELPLALTRSEARGVAERWLAEARIARDTLRFALPPSAGELGPGDTIILDGPASGRWRIDQIEDTGILRAEAVRIEPETYLAHDVAEETAQLRSLSAAVPVEAVFLDLPLMSGEEEPHAPHVAVTAKPWPGSAALYAAQGGASFALDRILARASNIGETLSALDQAPPGLYDRGPALVVRMVSGQLSSATPEALFSGANLVAIGSGADDVWELFQFEEALLIAPNTYELKMRLRGQAGSDAVMPAQWPVGSRLVIMNGVPEQISLAQADRGLARTYRWGPAQKPVDDAAYRQEERSFGGIGLRPYSVAHLRHVAQASGDVGVSWIRRTRIEGDPWSEGEVPLGETYERYALRVMQGAVVLREIELSTAAWIYSTADQTSDGVVGTYSIEVAQISDRFGNGPFIATQVN